MEQKINIAEILRDCQKGMELYSPIFGTVYFEGIRDTGRAILIDVTTSCNTSVQFYSDGKYNTYYSESEVTLFPSKGQMDWSKFQRPFKDGDILYVKADFDWICIYKESEDTENVYEYVAVRGLPNVTSIIKGECCLCCREDISEIRLATEEEKGKLFKDIKDNGYEWNAETKTLEKMVKPKFKVGDRIKNKTDIWLANRTIKSYDKNIGYFTTINDWVRIEDQDNWELVPNKFDITTLKPFESKVLVRDGLSSKWLPAIWGFYNEDGCDYHYEVVGGNSFSYCIPYEGNEHLRGTTNDCDDYYKTWK